jgi:hypothetical protein
MRDVSPARTRAAGNHDIGAVLIGGTLAGARQRIQHCVRGDRIGGAAGDAARAERTDDSVRLA